MGYRALALVLITAALGCWSRGVDNDPPCDLEPMPRHHENPDWSPDGTMIVFWEAPGPSAERIGGLFLYNLLDSTVTPFLHGYQHMCPKFSPDGRWIALSYGRNIYIVSITRDSVEQLTFSTDNFFPDWSPDGTKIAYDVSAGDERGIYILDLSTKETRMIYPYAECPAWFPNGEHLAVNSCNFQSGPELAIIDTSGNLVSRLTDNDSYKRGLDVSPDGSQICFTQHFGCERTQLWIVNRDGSGLKRLTDRGGDTPAFSPDGQWIVYCYLGDYNGCLWIMRPDGSEKRQLTYWHEDE